MSAPDPNDAFSGAWDDFSTSVSDLEAIKLERIWEIGARLAATKSITDHKTVPSVIRPALEGMIAFLGRIRDLGQQQARRHLRLQTLDALDNPIDDLASAMNSLLAHPDHKSWAALCERLESAYNRMTSSDALRLLSVSTSTDEQLAQLSSLRDLVQRLLSTSGDQLTRLLSEAEQIQKRSSNLLEETQRVANIRFFVSRARAARRRKQVWILASLVAMAGAAALYSGVLVGGDYAWRLIVPLTLSISFIGGVCAYQVVSATRLEDQYEYKAALASHLRTAEILGGEVGKNLLQHFPLLAASEINARGGGASDAVPVIAAFEKMGGQRD